MPVRREGGYLVVAAPVPGAASVGVPAVAMVLEATTGAPVLEIPTASVAVAAWPLLDDWLPVVDAVLAPLPDPSPPPFVDVVAQAVSVGPSLQGNVVPRPRTITLEPQTELYPVPPRAGPPPGRASSRWYLTGVTRDSGGTPLGDCRVIVFEVGRLAVTGAPVVAEAMSDGSGAYSIEVPQNTLYQVLAYKPGAPDLTGASVQTTPTAG